MVACRPIAPNGDSLNDDGCMRPRCKHRRPGDGSAGLGRRRSDDGTKLPGLAVTDRKPGKVRTETTAGRLPLGSAASTGRT
jgi:hypothetical protein